MVKVKVRDLPRARHVSTFAMTADTPIRMLRPLAAAA